jgi:hypothetical protein
MNSAASLQSSLSYWKFVSFKMVNGYFIAFGGAVIAAGVLDPTTSKWIACAIVGSKFLEGFMDQEITRTKTKIEGDTQQFLRSQIRPQL